MLIQRATAARRDRRSTSGSEQQIVEVADRLDAAAGRGGVRRRGRHRHPGLHDHHVHLHSAAAALTSVRVGPRRGAQTRRSRARRSRGAASASDGWIRAVGYHDAVAGPLDRDGLDELSPPVPVRVQHRSGVLWTLNSAGLARVGLPDHPDGRLRSADRSWSDTLQRSEPDLAEVSRRLRALRRHRRHRCHPGSRSRRHREVREAHQHGELRAAGALPGAGQAHPARRRPGSRRADGVDRRAARRAAPRSRCTV